MALHYYRKRNGTSGQWRRPGAEFGGTEHFFADQDFWMTFFSGKNFHFTPKISDDLFLVIDQVFRISPFFSQIFRIFTMLNVVYDPFLTRKTPFFTLLILSSASDNTTSKNIGGTDAWAVPPPHILGDRPSVPLGLRPCKRFRAQWLHIWICCITLTIV